MQVCFANKIRESRESKQVLQHHISATLDMDNTMYCKIEKGERRAKGEQVVTIADTLQTDKEELLALWLADQVPASVANEKGVVDKALGIVKQKLKE